MPTSEEFLDFMREQLVDAGPSVVALIPTDDGDPRGAGVEFRMWELATDKWDHPREVFAALVHHPEHCKGVIGFAIVANGTAGVMAARRDEVNLSKPTHRIRVTMVCSAQSSKSWVDPLEPTADRDDKIHRAHTPAQGDLVEIAQALIQRDHLLFGGS